MDGFVEKAFKDSLEQASDGEFNAFKNEIIDKTEIILKTIGARVGFENMDMLSSVILKSNLTPIFNDFIEQVFIISFHRGYKRGRESL